MFDAQPRNRRERRWVNEPFLPLRDGQRGHFLNCFRGKHFINMQQTRGMREGARFRNATIGVTFEYRNLQWMPVDVDAPDGCRYCDTPRHKHARLWSGEHGVSFHTWTAPTNRQRLYRMRWRRWYSGKLSAQPERVPS